MELKDTIRMMESKDYKERFRAEYFQAAIRKKELEDMLEKWDNKELGFTPPCPRHVYGRQLATLESYVSCLMWRAGIEGIDLNPPGGHILSLEEKEQKLRNFVKEIPIRIEYGCHHLELTEDEHKFDSFSFYATRDDGPGIEIRMV